ncbi:MAG: DMT family transporter [Rhizobacter sp.]|nr:DMT family transporter [Rhizobacter sp.]
MASALLPLAIAALLLATTAWGSLFLVGKAVVGVIDPLWFTVLRYALATLVLLVLVQAFGRTPWAKLQRHFVRLTLLGVAGYGVFSVLVFYGLRLSAPSHGSVIMATMPFTTLGLRWALDGQRPSGRALVGAGLALIGVATVADVFGAQGHAAPGAQLGDLITLAGTLGWVLYTRGAARLPDHSPLEYTALTAVASLPWLVLAALIATALGLAPLPAAQTLAHVAPQMLYVALVPTVAAALAYNFGVRRLGAPVGTLFLNMVPVSVIVVHALLGQPPLANELVGAGLVAVALAFNAWPARPAAGACRPGAAVAAAR